MNCSVSPTVRFAVAGKTVMVVSTGGTGGVTVTAAVPITDIPTDALYAPIVVVPAASAVNSPVSSIVPIAGVTLPHVKTTSGITLSYWSYAVAVNCSVLPTVRFAVAGKTVMVVSTGGSSVIITSAMPFTVPFSA